MLRRPEASLSKASPADQAGSADSNCLAEGAEPPPSSRPLSPWLYTRNSAAKKRSIAPRATIRAELFTGGGIGHVRERAMLASSRLSRLGSLPLILSFRLNPRESRPVGLRNLEAVGLDCAFVLAHVASNRGGQVPCESSSGLHQSDSIEVPLPAGAVAGLALLPRCAGAGQAQPMVRGDVLRQRRWLVVHGPSSAYRPRDRARRPWTRFNSRVEVLTHMASEARYTAGFSARWTTEAAPSRRRVRVVELVGRQVGGPRRAFYVGRQASSGSGQAAPCAVARTRSELALPHSVISVCA